MSYQRRDSPLHAVRAAVGCLYCVALIVAALLVQEPIVLGAILMSMLGAGTFAGVGRELRRALLFAVPMGLLIAVINMFASQQGLTVIARLGDLPVLGNIDITLEATVYGGVLALRAIALITCGALYTLTVDPDRVLSLFRRVSFRSALTATLATRLVPVLVRDSRRVADARRCRAVGGASRFAVMRAVGSGVLDRALDVAAALEVRGYGGAGRPARATAPWSRFDWLFLSSAVAVFGLAIAVRMWNVAPFHAYPGLYSPVGWPVVLVAIGFVAISWLPFLERRGVAR